MVGEMIVSRSWRDVSSLGIHMVSFVQTLSVDKVFHGTLKLCWCRLSKIVPSVGHSK